jgi:hypothetical protein
MDGVRKAGWLARVDKVVLPPPAIKATAAPITTVPTVNIAARTRDAQFQNEAEI